MFRTSPATTAPRSNKQTSKCRSPAARYCLASFSPLLQPVARPHIRDCHGKETHCASNKKKVFHDLNSYSSRNSSHSRHKLIREPNYPLAIRKGQVKRKNFGRDPVLIRRAL